MSSTAPRRNDPCPCGSGKRFKHCHGSLTPDQRLETAQRQRYGGDWAGAIATLDAAIADTPDAPALHNARAFYKQEIMALDEAEAGYRHAIALSPDFAHAHFNLALLLLIQGRYEEGWREYEWRARRPNYNDFADFPFGMPRWKGESLAGKRILVHAEQGLGDTIQCARFLEPLAREAAAVDVFFHPPIEAVMQRMRGVRRAYGTLHERPTHDFHAPIIDVAAHFLPTGDSPHWFGRYLEALPERVAQWAPAFAHLPRPLVGIVWKGSPSHECDHMRSLTPALAAELTRNVPGVTFVNLQYGEGPPPGTSWIDFRAQLRDWDDTLAILHHLDLLIAVDTSVVHAAGAMERPVWVLRPFDPEWRWGLDREASRWYPTVRLIPQPAPGDWPGVIAEVHRRLASQNWRSATSGR